MAVRYGNLGLSHRHFLIVIRFCSLPEFNSLPNWVVAAINITVFKIRLDKHWQHQDLICDFRAQLTELEVVVRFRE